MAKVQMPTELDAAAFISQLTRLKISELEAFARELDGLIYRKKSRDKVRRSKELLQLINETVLPEIKRERYIELNIKVEDETIAPEENIELLRLVEEEEKIRNQRVAYLIELARLRNISLVQLMEELGLNIQGHG